MKKLTILTDMDGILVDMFEPLLGLVEKEHGIKAAIENLTQWDMGKCPPLDQMNPKDLYGYFKRPGFFRNMKPLPGTLEGFKKLFDAGHQMVIVSTPSGSVSAAEKFEWLAEHLPYLSDRDVFLGSHKHMVKGDVLIDDRGETLQKYTKEWPQALCLGIRYPYNYNCDNLFNGDYFPNIQMCGTYQDTEYAWNRIVARVESFSRAGASIDNFLNNEVY